MIDHPLLAMGLLLLGGWAGGRAANVLDLPRVTGYLVAGMLLSPALGNIISRRTIDQDLILITEVALGVIAYAIGGSLVWSRMKRLGRSIAWITMSQALGAFFLSMLMVLLVVSRVSDLASSSYTFINTYLPLSLVIGAISVATAPGAILAIISELKSSGPFTTILLGVIALDDALAIIFFALAGAVAHVLVRAAEVSWLAMLGGAVAEIIISILLGVLVGLGLYHLSKLVRRRESLLMVVLGAIFFTSGFALMVGLSPLLANMVVGFFLINQERHRHDLFWVVEQIEETLFGLFFTLAGAHLDLMVLKSAGLLALALMLGRMAGKQFGAWLGAVLANSPPVLKKYLGLALLPKAGVTVGLVLTAQEIFPLPVANVMVNTIIGTVILNELLAPPLVKYALIKAGEVPKRESHENQ